MSSIGLAAQAKTVVSKALSRVGDVSTLPEVTAKIISLVEDPESTAHDLHEVIRTDPALSARVLKVVNSSFYGLPGQVASVDRAIILLGMSAVKNIAIAASIARMFKPQDLGAGFSAKDVWIHSVAVGVAARNIAHEAGFAGTADELFLAGLMHDLGILVELQAFPEEFRQVVEQTTASERRFRDVELEILGADHQAFGEGLVTKWKFPRNLRAVVGFHHCPDHLSDELAEVGRIICVADRFCCQQKVGFHLTAASEELTGEMLESVGLTFDGLTALVEPLHEQLEEARASLVT